ncbi:fungal transcriptional regulatory protein [Ophiostoma piceae UAMH 11346]|uniref:Fungal transcriptional regulatory protein n=1 Tax=Ophiostoma piceae (strain UAMH 11346) TaxID=1262450 RepID=S3C4R7_OPHP1|nr:fungal transcriptional regulatory protein [Ophiostoma piceae UAMH 11346]
MASIQPGTASEAEQKKRRACDECRTRKLACSKESDGCRRCKREGIVCIYSAQKQMGRPRKRPRFDGEDVDMAGNVSGSGTNHDASPLTVDNSPGITPTPNNNNNEGDVGLSMLADQASSPTGLSFFDFLGVGADGTNNDGTNSSLDPFLHQQSSMQPSADTHPLASIPSVAVISPMPGLSAPASGDPSSEQAQPTLITPNLTYHKLFPHSLFAPNRVCGCLARLYLALDSLQHLPTEIGPAMSVARNAAHTAHDTILCPSCSPENVTDIDYRPPMQSYQNLMILGALLPSLAHTYRRIVTMVDEEAARASAAKVRLAISLTEYGGVWGHMARWDNVCEHTSSLDNSVVDPPLWRLVVRALLKMDVYGIHLDRADADIGNDTGAFKEGQLRTEGKNACFASNTSHAAASNASNVTGKDGAQHFMVPVHFGLKDIAEMMQERAQRRHQWMDAAYDAGLLKNLTDTEGYCAYKRLPPGEKHNCEKIIEMAKQEIDQLVIV